MVLAGFFGLGFFVFFKLTQPNKTPRVWVFSALVAQAGKTQKIVKIYFIITLMSQLSQA